MLASGLAEKKADEEAEQEMRAYLATFQCSYADDKRVAGGETNIEVPGGNELVGLYGEYVTLANDLKARKASLGIAPGIESEPILDGATSGLYDDIGTGINSGAYISLARALLNPSGTDAAKWAEQTQKTKDLITAGAVVGGVGVVGGIVGNVLLNHTDGDAGVKSRYKNLINKLDKIQKTLDNADGQSCAEILGGRVTGNSPNCSCPAGEMFHPDYRCYDEDDYELSESTVDVTSPKGKEHVYTVTFHSDSAFKSGGAVLNVVAENAIKDIQKILKDNAEQVQSTDYEIWVVGYTDKVQPDGGDNEALSKKRANAVKDALTRGQSVLDVSKIKVIGAGDAGCAEENEAKCRRVDLNIYVDSSVVSGELLKGVADALQAKK